MVHINHTNSPCIMLNFLNDQRQSLRNPSIFSRTSSQSHENSSREIKSEKFQNQKYFIFFRSPNSRSYHMCEVREEWHHNQWLEYAHLQFVLTPYKDTTPTRHIRALEATSKSSPDQKKPNCPQWIAQYDSILATFTDYSSDCDEACCCSCSCDDARVSFSQRNERKWRRCSLPFFLKNNPCICVKLIIGPRKWEGETFEWRGSR